jgi:hypothetical protein
MIERACGRLSSVRGLHVPQRLVVLSLTEFMADRTMQDIRKAVYDLARAVESFADAVDLRV